MLSIESRLCQQNAEVSQHFLRVNQTVLLNAENCKINKILKDDRPSMVVEVANGAYILKLIKARTWHELPKTFWGSNRASKEFKGNALLASIGLNVPVIFDYALGVFPARNYRYVGFYVMENLRDKQLIESYDILQQESLSTDYSTVLFENFIADVQLMAKHRIVFPDLSFRNVFVDTSAGLTWIDTGVNRYTCPRKFEKKYRHTIERFLREEAAMLSRHCDVGVLEKRLLNQNLF